MDEQKRKSEERNLEVKKKAGFLENISRLTLPKYGKNAEKNQTEESDLDDVQKHNEKT